MMPMQLASQKKERTETIVLLKGSQQTESRLPKTFLCPLNSCKKSHDRLIKKGKNSVIASS
jgi:hypothetical protein